MKSKHDDMKTKHFLALLVAVMMSMATAAQTGNAVVTVNGQEVSRALAQITFEGDNVVLHFADGTANQTEDMSVVAVSLSAATGIDLAQTFTVTQLVGDQLMLGGIGRGERIAIYDANGRRMMQTTASGSVQTLPLEGLSRGVYIVRAGEKIIKFAKK